MKRALILGAGLVAKPMVDYLLEQKNVEVVMASRTVEKAQEIIGNRKNAKAVPLLMDNDEKLEDLIKQADIVISLLPYTFHVKVAEYCLKHELSMVTTSYVSPQMKALNERAKEKGVLILNEIGLDPGIDHLSAMRIIHDVQERGGKVSSFLSYCGGLPAPESNDNPWGYKFSWSPRGVLMAGRNSAQYWKNGETVRIDGNELFENVWPIQVEHLELETYPNRDSLPYVEFYGIQNARTMFRGTLRYPGWCRTLNIISHLGLLAETEIENTRGLTYRGIMQKIFGLTEEQDPVSYIAEKSNIFRNDEVIQKLDWLEIFSDRKFEEETTTPIDFLASLMKEKMRYQPGEKDMIVLHHDFIGEFPDRKERLISTLINYGEVGGDSAMSRAVSLPAAIAVHLILEGKVKTTGVHIPVMPEIYNPVLEELERYGIVCQETKEVLE